MAQEIERKFLVASNSFLEKSTEKIEIAQGYLSVEPDRTVRVRVAGEKGYLTVKTRNHGAVRSEWEYQIPADEAYNMIDEAAINVILKTRYFIPEASGLMWEVDCFHGSLEGLKIAEIELPEVDTLFEIPDFIGDEITGDPRYYNSNLKGQVQ